jgi:dihydroorotate dehydrogenase
LIGIGGIDSPERARLKIEAGASLIQIYTGLVYEGPLLIGRIKSHLTRTIESEQLSGVGTLVGRKAQDWAGKPWPA